MDEPHFAKSNFRVTNLPVQYICSHELSSVVNKWYYFCDFARTEKL